jgi:hypothetical protein
MQWFQNQVDEKNQIIGGLVGIEREAAVKIRIIVITNNWTFSEKELVIFKSENYKLLDKIKSLESERYQQEVIADRKSR